MSLWFHYSPNLIAPQLSSDNWMSIYLYKAPFPVLVNTNYVPGAGTQDYRAPLTIKEPLSVTEGWLYTNILFLIKCDEDDKRDKY